MGLSFQEFSILTPAEFEAIHAEWHAGREAEIRGEWERCRWICYYAIKPYAKESLHVTDVLKFGWDDSPGKGRKMTKRQREAERKKIKKLIELWKDDDE